MSNGRSALERSGQSADEQFSPDEPGRDAESCDAEKKAWIEIQLVGEDDQPIPNQRYRIQLPDGTLEEGVLDDRGIAGVKEFTPGSCKVSFPDLDQDAWEPV